MVTIKHLSTLTVHNVYTCLFYIILIRIEKFYTFAEMEKQCIYGMTYVR